MARKIEARSLVRVHQLWDELADFDASQSDEACAHLMSALCRLAGAQNAYWLGAVRIGSRHAHDPLRGWRPRAIQYLHTSIERAKFYRQAQRDLDAGEVDESTRANVRDAGTFRASLLRDLVSPAWFESQFYDVGYRALGIFDAVFVVSPVNRDAESYFGFQRAIGQKPFTDRERDLLAYTLRPFKAFHRQMMLGRGLLVAHTALTPMEQRVTSLLLTSLSEKEIAGKLGLTPRTVHAYVTQIFRKFGVSGRPGLTALWLGQPKS